MRVCLFFPILFAAMFDAHAQAQMERLSRGVVAVRSSSSSVYVGWRLFGNDPSGIAFNLYRSTAGGAATLLNGAPITTSTNFVDNSAPTTQPNTYFVRPVLNGVTHNPEPKRQRLRVLDACFRR
jgi:hypothetical protein